MSAYPKGHPFDDLHKVLEAERRRARKALSKARWLPCDDSPEAADAAKVMNERCTGDDLLKTADELFRRLRAGEPWGVVEVAPGEALSGRAP